MYGLSDDGGCLSAGLDGMYVYRSAVSSGAAESEPQPRKLVPLSSTDWSVCRIRAGQHHAMPPTRLDPYSTTVGLSGSLLTGTSIRSLSLRETSR